MTKQWTPESLAARRATIARKKAEKEAAAERQARIEKQTPAQTLAMLEGEYAVLTESVKRAEENFRLASWSKRELFNQISALKRQIEQQKFWWIPADELF